MKIYIATDHNGVNEKLKIKEYLENKGYEVVDMSQNNYDTDDYPDYAFKVAESVANTNNLGILMCGTGIGMSIAANKVKGIRCAKVSSLDEARLCKQHNNANIIALSYKVPMNDLIAMVDTFIQTPFANEERHIRRINMITERDNNNG